MRVESVGGGSEGGREGGGREGREGDYDVSEEGFLILLLSQLDYNQCASTGDNAATYWIYIRRSLLDPGVGCDLHRVGSCPKRERGI